MAPSSSWPHVSSVTQSSARRTCTPLTPPRSPRWLSCRSCLSRRRGLVSASGPRSDGHDARPVDSSLRSCHFVPSSTSSLSTGEPAAPPAGSNLRFCFGYCRGGHGAPPSAPAERICLRGGSAGLLSHHGLCRAPEPCSGDPVAPPAALGSQSRGVYAPDAFLEILCFYQVPARCGRPWAPSPPLHVPGPSS